MRERRTTWERSRVREGIRICVFFSLLGRRRLVFAKTSTVVFLLVSLFSVLRYHLGNIYLFLQNKNRENRTTATRGGNEISAGGRRRRRHTEDGTSRLRPDLPALGGPASRLRPDLPALLRGLLPPPGLLLLLRAPAASRASSSDGASPLGTGGKGEQSRGELGASS